MARRRKRRGLGEVNVDARAAIQAARAGRCSTALKHLYDASPHIQSSAPTDVHRQDFRIASQIVNKLCVTDKPSKKRGRKYRTGGFDGSPTLHQALKRKGFTSKPSKAHGARDIYDRKGNYVTTATASEGWALVKRTRRRKKR